MKVNIFHISSLVFLLCVYVYHGAGHMPITYYTTQWDTNDCHDNRNVWYNFILIFVFFTSLLFVFLPDFRCGTSNLWQLQRNIEWIRCHMVTPICVTEVLVSCYSMFNPLSYTFGIWFHVNSALFEFLSTIFPITLKRWLSFHFKCLSLIIFTPNPCFFFLSFYLATNETSPHIPHDVFYGWIKFFLHFYCVCYVMTAVTVKKWHLNTAVSSLTASLFDK